MKEISQKKQKSGVVLSDAMTKTVVVGVEKVRLHRKYGKRLRSVRKIYAHNELEAKKGDKVLLEEARPISKLKRWRVIKVVN